MFQSIRSKILLLVIGLVLIILITFAFNTKKNYQAEITTQYHNLAVESLNSVMKVIDAEYNDLLTYEIDTISHTRSLMENIGASILPMIDSFYDQQKAGFVTEQLAKEQCLNRIEEYRYQNNNYFFVFDTNLTGLAHPNKEMVGKKWSGFQDLKKKDALNRIQKIIKNKKKSFTVFMWPRLEDMKTVKQLGFFIYYPRWEWIIGTAFQLNNIEKKSLEKEAHISSKLNNIFEKMNINTIGGILIFDSFGNVVIHSSHLKDIDINKVGITLKKIFHSHSGKTANHFENPVEYLYTNKTQKKINQTAYVNYYKFLDWHIATFIDHNEIEKLGSVIAAKQYVFFLLILVFGIFVAIFISKRITHPLTLLTQYSRDLPNRDFMINDNPLPKLIKSNDDNNEITQLKNAFVFMESELGKNVRNLEQHKKNLERLVNIRTVELTDVNKDLNQEIKYRKYTEKSLNTLNKTLDEKVNKRTSELRKLNKHLIYTEEKGRSKFATDLHDTVAQTLAFSVSKIKDIKEADGANDLKKLSEVQELIELSIQEVRQMIYQLSPPVLKDFDIATAIGFLLEEINERFHFDITFINKLEDSIDIDEYKKVTLYRAVNELILNISKHSGLKEAKVDLSQDKNFVLLKIEDHGVGFDMTSVKTPDSQGFGLYGLSERCNAMGGEFKIESTPGKGTKATLYIPIN